MHSSSQALPIVAPRLDPAMALGIVALRVGLGLVYLTNGLSKLTGFGGIHPFPGFLITFGGARGIIAHDVQTHPIHLYRDFILNTVVPNWNLFGGVVVLGELFVGVCLVLGLLSPLAALVGAGFQLHLNFANWGNNIWAWEYAVEWIPLIALAFMHSGHYWGLDPWLVRRLPVRLRRWPFV